MGSKSQRRKERHAQRRKEKRKQQEQTRIRQGILHHDDIPVGSNARHRQRLAQQIPSAWPGEMSADVAIFEDGALSLLTPELASQAMAVRAALQEALELRSDDALQRLSAIPRESPFRDWRLFIRGLTDWLSDRTEAANEAWQRLNPERRPGRIATVMMVALRSDLEQAVPCEEQPGPTEFGNESPTSACDRFDAQQLYHAKLLRRMRFDRAALRVAESGLSLPEEAKDLLLGPRKIHWLKRFIEEYGDTEPDLAVALAQTALGRAFAQNFSDVFDDAVRTFAGPRHDRRNRLLTFFYYSPFGGDAFAQRTAERALNDYLNSDLPQNEALSAPLRGAIASQIHLHEARVLMRPDRGEGMFDWMFEPPDHTQAIRSHLLAAVKAAPNHSSAYQAHVEWIQSKLDDDRLAKSERTRLEAELAAVMRSWSQGAPDEVEPRLWLVDFLLENEQLEEARPHVDFLAAYRQDNPRVRATPWKWQLLEAMRLCRRKAWLADVPARLDEAEAMWPAWLPQQWLPYFRAAWTLRTGRLEAFADQRRQICAESGRVRDSLADACMMLGAAQQMRVAATDLKPLRAVADRALQAIDALPLEDLLETGGFFWDLHRVQLLYPASRAQEKIIGKALFARWEQAGKMVIDGLHDERIQKGVLWGSQYRFWSYNYETKLPSFFADRSIQRHPIFAAAKLNALLKQRYSWGIEKYRELGPLLREAAPSQRDAFYRHWFADLAARLDDVLAKESQRFSGFPFGNLFGAESEDEDDDDDDLGFDPDCNCPACRAARKAHEQAASSRTPFS
jgi:hypothetical protein